MQLLTGPKPDVTPPQGIAAVLGGIPILATLLHVFGVYSLSKEQTDALEQTVQWGVILAGLLVGGDGVIRAARNAAVAKTNVAGIEASASSTASVPPDVAHPQTPPVVEADLTEDELAANIEDLDVDDVKADALPSDEVEAASPPPGG